MSAGVLLGLEVGSAAISGLGDILGASSASNAAAEKAAALRHEAAYRKLATDLNLRLLYARRDFALANAERQKNFSLQKLAREARQVKGMQRSRFAATGVDVSAGGSPMAMLSHTAAMADYDARIASYNELMEKTSTQYETDAEAAAIRLGATYQQSALSAQANIMDSQAKEYLAAGVMNLGSTLLGSATSIYRDKEWGLLD